MLEQAERAIAITFYGRVPSKKNNQEVIMRNGKPMIVPGKAYRKWEQAEAPRLKALHGSPKLTGYRITITPFLPDNLVKDVDGFESSILDCLTKAGVIADDRWQMATRPAHRHQPVIDRENPRIEVLVEW